MKIKTIILCASFLFAFAHFSFAQLKEVARSLPIKELNVTASYEGIISGEDGCYMLHLSEASKDILTGNIKKTSYELIRFNREMQQIKVKLTDIIFQERKTEIEYFTILDHKIHIFVSTTDKANDLKYVHHHQFDPIDLEPIGQPQKVYESSFKGISKHSSRFSLALSPDGSKILFYEENMLKKVQTEFGFFMLNKMGEIEWEGKFTLEKDNKKRYVQIRKALVDDKGNVFLLKKEFKNSSIYFEQPIGHGDNKYALLFLKNKTEEKTTIPIAKNDKKIKDLDMGFLDNKMPFMLGYYSDKNLNYTNGIILINCPSIKENAKLDFSLHPFSEETLNLNLPKRVGLGKAKMTGYLARSVFQNEDKTLTIIGENITAKPPLKKKKDEMSYNKEIEHGSILVSKVSSTSGKILWSNKVPKKEHQEIEHLVNFCTIHKGTDLLFIYNDHADNMEYSGHGKIKSPSHTNGLLSSDTQVSLATIDSNGKLKTQALQTESGKRVKYFYPFCSFKVSDKEIIIVKVGAKKQVELVKFRQRV